MTTMTPYLLRYDLRAFLRDSQARLFTPAMPVPLLLMWVAPGAARSAARNAARP
jgi:hypothetical protein